MKIKGSFSFFLITFFILESASFAQQKKVNILWGQFSRPWTLDLVKSEIEKPVKLSDPTTAAHVDELNLNLIPANPFNITDADFFLGLSRPYEGETVGAIPEISDAQAAWFDRAVAAGQLPDVFVVAGHQVISEGWHNDAERMFMFLPTLLQSLKNHKSAQIFFDHIRLAVLWGCNTMTDLEPHGPNGEYLTPEQIKTIYNSGPKGRLQVIGAVDKVNTLEFYRQRLYREYGPGNKKVEYVRSREQEKCLTKPYINCPVTNLDRILPDKYLFDGSHVYNYPYMMKRVFPSATVVFGFSSASPPEETRVKIFQETLDKTYADLNAAFKQSGKKINNILYPLTMQPNNPLLSDDLNRMIIKSLRKNWTLSSDAMNRNRPSGSISPAYPDLDADGVLGAPLSRGSKQYGPFEARNAGLNPLP
jgi:hypothetical protein